MDGVMLEMLVLGDEAVPPLLGRTQVESCRLVLEAAVEELDGVEDTGGPQGGNWEQDWHLEAAVKELDGVEDTGGRQGGNWEQDWHLKAAVEDLD